VYLSRELVPNKSNVFRFRVLKTKNQDFWIGLERRDPKHVWFCKFKQGELNTISKQHIPYKHHIVLQNDVIQLRVDSDTVTYYVNQTCMGVAF